MAIRKANIPGKPNGERTVDDVQAQIGVSSFRERTHLMAVQHNSDAGTSAISVVSFGFALVILALIGTGLMAQTRTIIFNTGYDQANSTRIAVGQRDCA